MCRCLQQSLVGLSKNPSSWRFFSQACLALCEQHDQEIQYQNNSLALQTSTANSVNANIADWYTAFFENAEASEAFMKFVSAPESVTPSERFRAIMRLHSLNLHLQNALYLEGKGVLDENLRKTISMAVYSGLGSPGFYVFWEQRKDMYTEEWRNFVEDLIQSKKDRNENLEKLFNDNDSIN